MNSNKNNNNNMNIQGEQARLDLVIAEVKKEFKILSCKRKDLITKLGNALEQSGLLEESICEEIKNILLEEIASGEISRRDIERYSLSNWKKKTRPKKNENDKMSFHHASEPVSIAIDNEGHSIEESLDPNHTKFFAESSNDKRYSRSKEIENACLANFELFFEFETLQEYMANEYRIHRGTETIWIHGTINRITNEIISFALGRNSQSGDFVNHE
jgi:hypothetical protein